MQRVLIAGSTGSGKSTLGRALSQRLGLPYTELDSLYHGPNWVPRPSFAADVAGLATGPRWVTEWQYDVGRPVLLARADALIWLDYPRFTTMHRVIRRSFRRAAFRQPMFNGNTENFRAWLDAEHPIRWAWTTQHLVPERVANAAVERPELTVIRLRSPRQTRRWLAGMG